MHALYDIAGMTAGESRLAAVRQQGRLLMENLDPRFVPEDRVELEERWKALRG